MWRPAAGLGERLKKAFGTESVQEIANRLEMSYQGVDHLIKGRRKLSDSLLIQISALTNCSIDWILTGLGPEQLATRPLFKRTTKEEDEDRDREFRAAIRDIVIDVMKEMFESSKQKLSTKDRAFADSLIEQLAASQVMNEADDN